MNLADAIGWTASAFTTPALALYITTIFRPNPERKHIADGLYAVGAWLAFIASAMDASPFGCAFFGLLAAWFSWLWWKNRRKGRGRKALRELGAKSRARIEAMVRQMSPSPIPSPVGGGA